MVGDRALQQLELLVALFLVLVLGIDLGKAAQPDTGLEHVHGMQVILPLAVNRIEQQELLDLTPALLAVLIRPRGKRPFEALDDLIEQLLTVYLP